MPDYFDIVIIGGGPAGAAAALTLKKRHPEISIIIVEGSHYEKWRVGETLTPDASKAFRELGIWDSFQKTNPIPAMGTCAAWESEILHENEYIFQSNDPKMHLDKSAS